MKPNIKKLVSTFQETAGIVKVRLKQKGFVLPVAHEGGIKFKHLWVKKDHRTGMYGISNLHNSKIVYERDIYSLKIAVAIAIYLGTGTGFNREKLLRADEKYGHYLNEIAIFKHTIRCAIKNNDLNKQEVAETRLDNVSAYLDVEKKMVNTILQQAEKLLFENK